MASEDVNARVNHWIRELQQLINTRDDSNIIPTPSTTSIQGENHLSLSEGYDVHRDSRENPNDSGIIRAGIEIRCRRDRQRQEEPVLLGLSCDSHEDRPEDRRLTAIYVSEKQIALGEREQPLRCFITHGFDEIHIVEAEWGPDHDDDGQIGWDIHAVVHGEQSLNLGQDRDAIRRHIINALEHNEALLA